MPFISSNEEKAQCPYVFEKTRVACCTPMFTRKTKVSSNKRWRKRVKLTRLLVNVSLNLTHFITRPNLALSYSVASSDRSFFRF